MKYTQEEVNKQIGNVIKSVEDSYKGQVTLKESEPITICIKQKNGETIEHLECFLMSYPTQKSGQISFVSKNIKKWVPLR